MRPTKTSTVYRLRWHRSWIGIKLWHGSMSGTSRVNCGWSRSLLILEFSITWPLWIELMPAGSSACARPIDAR